MERQLSDSSGLFRESLEQGVHGDSHPNLAAASVICVIDRDQAVCRQIAELLDNDFFTVHAFQTVGQFHAQSRSQPDCLLVDFTQQDATLAALQVLQEQRYGCVAPVIVTGSGIVGDAVRYMKAGAADYIAKPLSEEFTLDCIRRTSAVGRANRVRVAPILAARAKVNSLTKREKQVLDLMVAGRSSQGVSEELQISIRTAELYRARIRMKFEAKNFVDVLHIAHTAARLTPRADQRDPAAILRLSPLSRP